MSTVLKRPRRDWQHAQHDRALVQALQKELDLPRVVAMLLVQRGCGTSDLARRFLEPSLENISAPLSLTDMDKAVARLWLARERDEHVRIFGDYDVDGIAGTAILVCALQRFGIGKVSFAMPDRLLEGYGISPDHVRRAQAEGVSLIVTVDNGVAAHEAAAEARVLGIDFVVTDHHQIEGELPPAVAVVNPQREPDSHPARCNCGAVVAFKLAWALTGALEDLDLAALGTVADVMPLTGENRDIVFHGLKAAAKRRVGLDALARVAKTSLDGLRAEHIAFQLGPRINAGGRIGDGTVGLKLLLCDDARVAANLAADLDAANEERRSIENRILREALAELESGPAGARSIVLAKRGWHAGVVGVVASRIQSRYYRPVVLVAIDEDGSGRGSGRSVPGFDIAQGLAACHEHLVTFGGHAAAAGVSIREENVEAFRAAFEAHAASCIADGNCSPPLPLDALVSLGEIDSRLVRALDQLEPYGHGNTAPVFCTAGARVLPNSVRELNGGHVAMTVSEGSRTFRAIGFRMAELRDTIEAADAVDIAFTPQFNTFRNETTIQLVLKDIRPAGA